MYELKTEHKTSEIFSEFYIRFKNIAHVIKKVRHMGLWDPGAIFLNRM
jgi:hypothetical protein